MISNITDTVFSDFDRLFSDRMRQFLGQPGWDTPYGLLEYTPSSQMTTALTSKSLLNTRLDLIESPSSYKVHIELPGVKKEDISVELNNDLLTIQAERKESVQREDERYQYQERRFGKMKRQVTLPKGADVKNIDSKFEDGVLELEFGKAPESETKKTITLK